MKKQKSRSGLLKTFLIPIIPLLFAVILTGSLLGMTSMQYAEESYARENSHVLDLTDKSITSMISSIDYYYYYFWTNSDIVVITKRLLSSQTYSYSDNRELELIRSFINSPVNTKSYLVSAYVYFSDYPNVLVSENGLIPIGKFYDQEWLAMVNDSDTEIPDLLRRSVRKYSFQLHADDILSVSRKAFRSMDKSNYGIVTVNLSIDKINEMLSTFLSYENQILLVCGTDDQVLFQTDPSLDAATLLPSLEEAADESRPFRMNNTQYLIYRRTSSENGLTLYSLVPTLGVSRLRMKTIILTVLIILMACLFGFVLLFVVSRRRYHMEKALVAIVEQYEASGNYPVDLSIRDEDFDYFYGKILGMFNRHNDENRLNYERGIKLEKAELMALQAQINPHFLYNTLEVISWKTLEVVNHYSIVNEMIENLSAILHYSLSDSDRLVPLCEEINITKRYIRIQSVRYGEQFDIQWDDDERCKNQLIPKLTLQPIIENAVQHGVISRYDGKGMIQIIIRQEDDIVRITIADNGAGIPADKLEGIRESLHDSVVEPSHIGLANTNQRLKLFFGDDYGLTVDSEECTGTEVTVIIPKTSIHITMKE